LVVEGDIIENTDVIFYLSRNFRMDSLNVPNESLDSPAKLYFIDSKGNKSQPAEYLGDGAYQVSVGALDVNTEYGVEIEYEGDTYQSILSKPLFTPEIDSVSWLQPEDEDPVSICISTHNDMEGEDFFLWTYKEDWEITVRYPTDIFYYPDKHSYGGYVGPPIDNDYPYQYCWKKNTGKTYLLGSMDALIQKRIVNKKLYQIEPIDDRLEELYSVIVTQKTISRSAFEYYQSFKEINEEMGGLFTPQPTEIIGNIACVTNPKKKVIGYVETIKNVTQKRLFVYRYHLVLPYIYPYCEVVESVGVAADFYYSLGYRPTEQMKILFWALAKCTDCRAKGGVKDRPDFWPNGHY
jgi:hypothetical protein